MISIKPNILINRQHAGGDVLMISPIVKKIFADRKGQCNIDVCCGIQNIPYLENNPYIRKIYRYALNDDKLKALGWQAKALFDDELRKIVEHSKTNFIW